MNGLQKRALAGFGHRDKRTVKRSLSETSLLANDLHPSPQGNSKKVLNDSQSLNKRWANRSLYAPMKTKNTVAIGILMSAALSFGYWLGYEHGSSPTVRHLNAVSSIKRIGLSFRGGRNDLTRFTATGTVAMTNTAEEGSGD